MFRILCFVVVFSLSGVWRVSADDAGLEEVALFECSQLDEGASCVVDIDVGFTYCTALDEEGMRVADANGAGEAGAVVFQDVEAVKIAAIHCGRG